MDGRGYPGRAVSCVWQDSAESLASIHWMSEPSTEKLKTTSEYWQMAREEKNYLHLEFTYAIFKEYLFFAVLQSLIARIQR